MLLVLEQNCVVALYIDGSLYNTATAGTGAFGSSCLNIANSRPYDDVLMTYLE